MKKKKLLGLIVLLVCIGMAIVLWCIFRNGGKEVQPIELQTSFATLEFPGMYADDLKHTETMEDGIPVEIFSMVFSGGEIELFRIYFGDAQHGTVEGYFQTDSGMVPISVLVGSDSQVTSLDEETSAQYYAMMDGLNIVLSSLYEDKRFAKNELMAQKESVKQMTYWSFNLPESMVCEEITAIGEYKAVFSLNYGDEKYTLYTVYMGDGKHGSPFGTYLIDGEERIISLEISESVQQEELPEGAIDSVYVMMDTISNVLDVITSDEHFSELAPEE